MARRLAKRFAALGRALGMRNRGAGWPAAMVHHTQTGGSPIPPSDRRGDPRRAGGRIRNVMTACTTPSRVRPSQSVSLIADLDKAARVEAEDLLGSCRVLSLPAHALRSRSDVPDAELLLLEEGFVVVRTARSAPARPIVTCEAADGGVLLPPAADELLEAVLDSRITVLPAKVCERLLALPGVARTLLTDMLAAIRRKQDAIASFGSVRHSERIRRKLSQLAGEYGRVTSDGIRLDLPLTHALLGEMIGSERETVTRSVDELEAEGFLSRDGRTYVLHVPPETLLR